MRVLDVRQLVPASIGQRFHSQETVLGHLLVQLRSRHRVRQRNLDRFAIQFLRKIIVLLMVSLVSPGKTNNGNRRAP